MIEKAAPFSGVRRLTAAQFDESTRVQKARVDATEQADQIVITAQQKAKETLTMFQTELDALRTEADGAAAAHINSRKSEELLAEITKLQSLGVRLDEDFDAIEGWLVDLVVTATQRIIAILPPTDVTLGLVRQGIRETRQRWSLEVRAHPDDLADIRALLLAQKSDFPEIENFTPNSDLARGGLQIGTFGGVREISLDVQIDVLRGVLANSFTGSHT